MRKIVYILTISLLLSCLMGCSQNNSSIQVPSKFYYCKMSTEFHETDSVITSETREIAGLNNDLTALLNHYLSGPISDDLTTPFLNGSSVENATVERGKATINLCRKFSLLKDYDLSLACICIAKTVFSVTDAETVILKANSTFHDGSIYKAFSRNSFMDNDNASQLN